MRDGLRAIHGAGPGEDEQAADAASSQPAAGRGGNGTYDLFADDRRARHLSLRNGHSPVPALRVLTTKLAALGFGSAITARHRLTLVRPR